MLLSASFVPICHALWCFDQTWGDCSTIVIDYDYLPPGRLRLRINKITM